MATPVQLRSAWPLLSCSRLVRNENVSRRPSRPPRVSASQRREDTEGCPESTQLQTPPPHITMTGQPWDAQKVSYKHQVEVLPARRHSVSNAPPHTCVHRVLRCYHFLWGLLVCEGPLLLAAAGFVCLSNRGPSTQHRTWLHRA